MRKLLLFLFTTNIISFSFSQSDLGFAPVGASWHYTTKIGSSSIQYGYAKYTVIKDTLINGKHCSEISISGNQVIPTIGLTNPFYVHYDSNRIYWQNIMTGQLDLLYDLNANVGDSWKVKLQCDSIYFPWWQTDTITYTVDSVYYDSLNGFNLKHLVTSISPNIINQSTNIHISEYLGGISIPFPHNFNCSGFGIHLWDGALRCYEDSVIGQNIWHSPCEILEVGLEKELNKNEISINPNPVDNLLILESSELLMIVELKDITGTTLFRRDINSNKIDVSEIPNGLYLISTVTQSGIRQTQKVIIQR